MCTRTKKSTQGKLNIKRLNSLFDPTPPHRANLYNFWIQELKK